MRERSQSSAERLERIERENLRRETLLEAIFQVDPGGLAVLAGPQLIFKMVNPAYRAITPHPEIDPVGRSCAEIWPEGEGFQVIHLIRRVLETGEPLDAENSPRQFQDGSWHYFTFHMRRIILDEEPAVLVDTWETSETVLALQHAQWRAQEAEEGKRILEAILDAVPATVLIASDRQCRSITANWAAYELLRMPYGANPSLSAGEDQAPSHFRIFHDGVEVPPEELPLQASAATGVEIRDVEEEIVFSDGDVRHVIGNVTPMLDNLGQPLGAVGAFVDITDRVQAERALRESEAALRKARDELEARIQERTRTLEELNQELRTEIAERGRAEAELAELQRRLMDRVEAERLVVAQELHDGPMQEIYGLTYSLAALADSLDEKPLRESAQAIQARLSAVNEVLRIMARELRPPTLAPFGLQRAILEHAERFQQLHPEIKLEFDLMPDSTRLPEEVRLALFRIYQIALANVVRHSQANLVEIRFRFDQQTIRLEIRDDGIGFEVPSRWISLAREGHLGLVGAKERAGAVGGRLEVFSRPGEGTSVRVEVPCQIPIEEGS